MAKWQILTIMATVSAGFVPIFSNKNVQNLGPILAMAANTAFWAICLGIWLFFNPPDFSLINKRTVTIVVCSQILSMMATYFIFRAYQAAPEKLSAIIVTTSFAVAITAVVNNFLKDSEKLSAQQWLGTVIALFGIFLVNWKR